MNPKNAKYIVGSLAALAMLASSVAFAQTTTTGTSVGASTTRTTGSTTPGAPNTGAGGDTAANLALLTTSGLVALAGAAYLARRKTV